MVKGSNAVNPIKYLDKISLSGTSLVVTFVHSSGKYSFYIQGGNLLYATNSILANSIIERHLKYLSHTIPSLKNIGNKLKLNLGQEYNNSQRPHFPPEFKKLIYLAEEKYLNPTQLSLLGKRISQEIIESLFLIDKISTANIKIHDYKISDICQHKLNEVIVEARKKIIQWQSLMPEIESTYQRAYLAFLGNLGEKERRLSSKDREKLGKILRGFNFRELGALSNVDELLIARRLYPLIQRQTVILRNPKDKLSLLPKLSDNILITSEEKNNSAQHQKVKSNILPTNKLNSSNKTYNIACIDDSSTVLNTVKKFLNQDNINVFPINNAAKAMMLMNSIKPDLIFMDIGMPLIDGYQLCSLLRKNAEFKNVPIIMLTASTGVINRAKAKISGATDYMTKPFTQNDLLTITFRYLNN